MYNSPHYYGLYHYPNYFLYIKYPPELKLKKKFPSVRPRKVKFPFFLYMFSYILNLLHYKIQEVVEIYRWKP